MLVAVPKTIRSSGQIALTKILVKERKNAALSQSSLAERLRCHQSLVARIESGERRIDVVELIIIARAIGIRPEEIVARISEVVPPDESI